MLEKLFLAAALTFSLNLVSEANWSVSSQNQQEIQLDNQPVLTLTLGRN
ncbi:MAG: hypothetical protein QNJ47_06085 [Nostocaceae cyanobacterium]|nr:hypothetical protein [Nostocaceae cyanobacterium]